MSEELVDDGSQPQSIAGQVDPAADVVHQLTTMNSAAREPSSQEPVLVLQVQDFAHQLPVWEPTGDQDVDAALEYLSLISDRALAEHAGVFDEVYRRLHGRLADLATGTS